MHRIIVDLIQSDSHHKYIKLKKVKTHDDCLDFFLLKSKEDISRSPRLSPFPSHVHYLVKRFTDGSDFCWSDLTRLSALHQLIRENQFSVHSLYLYTRNLKPAQTKLLDYKYIYIFIKVSVKAFCSFI